MYRRRPHRQPTSWRENNHVTSHMMPSHQLKLLMIKYLPLTVLDRNRHRQLLGGRVTCPPDIRGDTRHRPPLAQTIPPHPRENDMTSPENTPQLPSPAGEAGPNPIQTLSPRLAGIVRRHGDGHRVAPVLAQGGVTDIATLTAGYSNGAALLEDISTSKTSSHWRGASLP